MELHSYQREAVEKAKYWRRWIFAFEVGLGKTAAAITAMKELNVKRALIVCPAIVRGVWFDEIRKWWGEGDSVPEVKAILYGRARGGLSKRVQADRAASYSAPVRIVSYSLVGEVTNSGDDSRASIVDCIILDEAHRLKNEKASQSKHVRKILEANPNAAVFALTGTLMPDQPKDCYNVLDLLWPTRFGKKFKFYDRYMQSEEITDEKGTTVYGREWFGIREDTAPELRQRLSAVSSRVTKAEVAHLLPPFMVQLLRIEGEAQDEVKTFADWQEAQEKLDSYGDQKIPHVLEWVEDAREQTTHLCVLTHRRETATRLAERIAEAVGTSDVSVVAITGDVSPERRNEVLAACRQAKSAVVVATMHSIGIGIDLTFCTQALFAELYYRPETVVQAIGRFSRLSGKVPSSVYLMCIQGTIDEVMANTLLDKIAAINTAMKTSLSEQKLQEALKGGDEKFLLDGLNKAVANYVDGGAYDI